MKQKLLVIFLLVSFKIFSQSVTVGSIPGTSFCSGTTFSLSYSTSAGFAANNVFTAQMSDASGSFTTPVNLASIAGTGASTFSIPLPSSTAQGSGYLIRVVTSNPVTTSASSAAFTVNAAPTGSFVNLMAFDVNSTPVTLSSGLPTGGTYSGPGVTGTTFNPATAGVGTHIINYRITGGNGCTRTIPAIFNVLAAPVINGLPALVCPANIASPITMTSSLTNPVYSGPGVSGNVFTPSVAGIGTHEISVAFDSYTLDYNGTYSPVAGTGTLVSLTDDVVSASLPIGFNFTFFQNTYNQFLISSNGFITFNTGSDSGCCNGDFIPSTIAPNNLIAAFWTDLYPPSGGRIDYFTTGTTPNRKLVVNYKDIRHYGNNSILATFQIVLFEGSNQIEIHTLMAPPAAGYFNTQGIENANGTFGVGVPGRNATNWSASNDFIRFVPVSQTYKKTVVVGDSVAPIVVTRNITAQVDAAGNVTITPAQVNNGSTDNCAIGTMALSKTTFNCTNIGANTVTLTVTDINGNTATGTATVTVQDTVLPTVITQNITAHLTAAGNVTITPAQVNNNSTDNCGVGTMSLSKTTFNCSNIGVNTVTLTVRDINGNSATGTATVTITETIAPTVATQNITVQLNAAGTVTITPSQVNNSSSDNCAISSFTLSKTTFNCTNIGPNTVTLTATDASGNSAGATAVVTVRDILLPVAITQNITVQLTAAGTVTITPAQVNNGSTDNCTITGMTLSKTTFNCTNIGANTVILTVTDAGGNSAAQTAVVTVRDTVPPTVITQNITVPLNALGTVTITPAQINNGSTDNCAVASLSLDKTTFNCSNIGANTVILTVTDANGNSATATATVTVQDTVAPTAITQNITAQLDATGNVTITPAQVNNNSTDNCAVATLALSKTTFNCTNIGANTITLTVTDGSGNAATNTAVVTIQDSVAPVVLTQNIIVQLDATGNVTITPAQVNNNSTDNCAIATMALSKTTFNCTNAGANTVTLTVTDVNGNSATNTAVVTVQDIVPPTVVTQNITVQLDGTGNLTISPSQVNDNSTDNCGIAAMTLSKTAFNCSNVGTNTVTLSVTDTSGNSAVNTATVTVQNPIAPIVLTQNITVQLDAAGNVTITPEQVNANSTDNCAVASMALDKTTFNCTNVGPNTVILTVTNVNGNFATNTAIVTVQDTIAPIVATQNVTAQLDATGNVTVTPAQVNTTSADNCAIATLALSKTAFDCTNIGANTVTLTVTDVNGNFATGTAVITIQDMVAPTVLTQNITVQLDVTGNVSITPVQINNNSTDNCAIASMTLDVSSFTCANVGPNTVTLIVTDVNGNSSSNTATVTVQDTVAPTALTQNIAVQLDATGNVVITPAQVNNSSTDNCAVATLVLSKTAFDCTNIGANTVTLTVTDVNGNFATNTAVVTVQDILPPVVVTQNITVQLDAMGNTSITTTQINNNSTDNCAIATYALDVTAFTCANVGPNTVNLTVTDVNGNSASNSAIVTVQDMVVPTVITQNLIIQLDASGNATITPAQINNNSTDNCAVASLALDKTLFDCTNIGANTVTLTVTDVNGNFATNTAIVTVQDNIAPAVSTQNITVQLDTTGNVTVTPAQVNNNSADNCAIATMSLNMTAFDCTHIGVNTVTLTVTDIYGNASSATAVVTVQDLVPPVVTTQDITVQLDAAGTATITTSQINNGSTDNCAIATLDLDIKTFNCSNIGANTVTLTVVDVNHNAATGTAIVTVQDTIVPTVITQNLTVQLDAAGNAAITTTQVNNGSRDNCGVATISLDKTTFDCSNVGPNTVTLTVTDVNGNTATNTAIVTVKDTIAPIIVSQPAIINLDASGNALLALTDVENGTTDNCAVQSIVLSKTNFGCADVGVNTVVITATDVNGNTAKQSVSVTIVDTVAPLALTQDIQVLLTKNGTVIITPAMVSISTDNCAIYTMSLDITTFNCSNIGDNTVTLTVSDKSGNTASATAVVTVLPVPVPTLPSLSQQFCAIDEPTISDIEINEVLVKWYADATSTKVLTQNTRITSGTYYVASQYGNCFSDRVAVNVTVKDAPAPSGESVQYVCIEQEYTIADLVLNEEEIVWYETRTGGVPLSASTVLEDKQKYYASYLGADCESTNRFEVEVIIRYCDVIIHNAISANGDGRNDYFSIEGASDFQDSKLEVFNRWGSVVYETSRYGIDGNLFKGMANKGGSNTGGLLPGGTYYYVFSFTNHDGSRITKTGFLHLTY